MHDAILLINKMFIILLINKMFIILLINKMLSKEDRVYVVLKE